MPHASPLDIAVLVNLRARRASARVVRAIEAALPDARVVSTRTLDDAVDAARGLASHPPDLVISGGGDGTAMTLLTEMRRLGDGRNPPPLALLPLGTGNAWAHTVGAPGWRRALGQLGRLSRSEPLVDRAGEKGPIPLRRFDLLDVGGMQAPFAGAGWDSLILSDYRAVKGSTFLPAWLREGPPGYALAVGSRSIPRAIFDRRPGLEVEVVNLGSPAITFDAQGNPFELPDSGPGQVLYRGPISVCGAGTTPDLGFGMRAFPFVGKVPGRFSARVYSGSVLDGLLNVRRVFAGHWRIPHDHQWLLDHCVMRFSRPVELQAGGDVHGETDSIEYRLADGQVDILDWRALGRQRYAA